MSTHKGGCHCGRIAFEVDAPPVIDALRCNCSICAMTDYLHLLVPAARFRLLRGGQDLATYSFGTRTAKHLFCRTCGIKSFYVPRSHPDGFSVNVHCLDPATVERVNVSEFDGQHWEESVAALAQRSPE
jgi:hypothetical protein